MGQYRKSVLPGYRQALPKYQQTGQVEETADPLGEDLLEIFDPTGISSYDDVYRTFKDPNAAWWEKGLAVAGALPIVGKFGKAAQLAGKGAKAVTKWQKAQKALKTVGASKPVQVIKKGLTPVAGFDKKISPVSRFVAGTTERALQNIPGRAGSFTRGVADFGSGSNQITRFNKGVDAALGTRPMKPNDVDERNKYLFFDSYKQKLGGNIYDGIYNNSLNPTDMYFYAVGGVPNNPGFNSLPDHVQRKIIANMMYGGSNLRTYQGDVDGSTVEDDGMDYEAYPDETSYYPDDMYDFTENQMIPGAAFSSNMQPVQTTPVQVGAVAPPNYGMVGPQMPAGYTPQPVAAPQQYSGVSIVDYLNQRGETGSDFASRKQLAAQLGIQGYRGTADQNMQMLAMLQGNSYNPVSGSKAGGKRSGRKKTGAPTEDEMVDMATYNDMVGRQNPFVAINPATGQPYAFDGNSGTGVFPPGGGGGQGAPASDDSDPMWPWAVGLGVPAAGAAYSGYHMFKNRNKGAKGIPAQKALPSSAQKLLPSSEMVNASKFKANVNAGKSVLSNINAKGFYTIEDIRALKNAGYKNENIQKMMSQFPKATAAQASTAAQRAKDFSNVSFQSARNTVTGQQAADYANKVRNAIAPGQKVVGQTSKASAFKDALRAGWNAAKATPALRILRRREDGGSTYSNGVFYGQGGNYPYGGNTYGQMPQMGQPLPQYRYGMQDGGSSEEMYVTPEQMEMLRQQGYDFDVIS